jgi:putative SOS response-associated peptidase YedK
MKTKDRLTILVSSTVYGIEELLDRVHVVLVQYGYDVWMSHKGTMPVLPNRTAFENCLAAVEACDLFLGIITTQYGSGILAKGQRSITH